MLKVLKEPAFNRDVKAAQKKHRNMAKLKQAISLIVENSENSRRLLITKFGDHALTADQQGRRECHLDHRQDWLLLYAISREQECVTFIATGSHDQLFGKRGR
jgi:mRNA interferase YafQ